MWLRAIKKIIKVVSNIVNISMDEEGSRNFFSSLPPSFFPHPLSLTLRMGLKSFLIRSSNIHKYISRWKHSRKSKKTFVHGDIWDIFPLFSLQKGRRINQLSLAWWTCSERKKERKKLNEPKLQSALDQEILNYTDIRNAGTRIVKRRKLG